MDRGRIAYGGDLSLSVCQVVCSSISVVRLIRVHEFDFSRVLSRDAALLLVASKNRRIGRFVPFVGVLGFPAVYKILLKVVSKVDQENILTVECFIVNFSILVDTKGFWQDSLVPLHFHDIAGSYRKLIGQALHGNQTRRHSSLSLCPSASVQ